MGSFLFSLCSGDPESINRLDYGMNTLDMVVAVAGDCYCNRPLLLNSCNVSPMLFHVSFNGDTKFYTKKTLPKNWEGVGCSLCSF